jgi:DNA-directed RNA polymerase specialized sigma24 family protein
MEKSWPTDGDVAVIEIGPEGGKWLRCSIHEEWKTVLSRTIRCGKKHSISVTRRRGISREDKSKLAGLVEASIGIKGFAKLKSKLESTVTDTIHLEEMIEKTENFETAAGACDENQLSLAQKLRTYKFQFKKQGLFFCKQGEFEVVEFVDEIWDRGTMTRNHPECDCGGLTKTTDLAAGLCIGEKIFITEGIEVDGAFARLSKLKVAANLFRREVPLMILPFFVSKSVVPPYLSFMTGVEFGDKVKIEIIQQPIASTRLRQFSALFGTVPIVHISSFEQPEDYTPVSQVITADAKGSELVHSSAERASQTAQKTPPPSSWQAVSTHLPFLRRYVRILTGSQASGDAFVLATMESLIANPSNLRDSSNSRVGLYRLFTRIWDAVEANEKPGPSGLVLPRELHLEQMTPRSEQAFLLLALEGFSEEDAAEILDCDVRTLLTLVEEAGRKLAGEISADVLIIEDETFIAMDLEALVENLGHNVIGIARTHSEALALATRKRPELILADIQLADGSSGLDAVNELFDTFEMPVIFVTSYPERFLTGQRPEPAFLIAKPFQLAVVSAVVSQALSLKRAGRLPKKLIG